jgi:outer membrane protein OmpA-like peptidoglycan-associated protein
MTDSRRSGRTRRSAQAACRICRAAAVAVLVLGAAATAATAQERAPDRSLAPPAAAPVSRLTITPSDFERWRASTPDRPDVAAVPDQPPPSLIAPPPPPPILVSPPAPPPATLAPPPVPQLPGPPAMPPAAAGAQPEAPPPQPGAASPPAAPALPPPETPQVATLPPESRDTTPVPAAPEALPRPAAIRILYAADATELPKAARKDLDGLAVWLQANPDVRVQIVGYASATSATGSDARRRSLFRTLAVRTYLVENGVLSTRMDVRALGDRTDTEPKDRVEVRLPPS